MWREGEEGGGGSRQRRLTRGLPSLGVPVLYHCAGRFGSVQEKGGGMGSGAARVSAARGHAPSTQASVDTHTACFVRHYHECLFVQQYWYCCLWAMFGTVRGFHVYRDLKKNITVEKHKKSFDKSETPRDRPFLLYKLRFSRKTIWFLQPGRFCQKPVFNVFSTLVPPFLC
jgi:hypothetical protein